MADFKKLRVWNKAHALAPNAEPVAAEISANELEYHLILAHDVGAMSESDFDTLMRQVVDIKRMLHGLIEKLSAH